MDWKRLIIMAYRLNKSLPKGVQGLPQGAQTIYRKAFNNAEKQYKNPQKRQDPKESLVEVCNKVAWAAVKKVYAKNLDGKWVKI